MGISKRSNLLALYLCYCLGLLGVHRFYVGRPLSAILQIFTIGGLGVWWTIDLVRIIRGRFIDDQGKTLKWQQPKPLKDKHQFAGFWLRGGSYLIDALIIMCIMFPIMFIYIVYVISLAAQHAEPNFTITMLYNFSSFFFAIAYYSYFHSSKNQATPGKRIVGVYVINGKGGRISILRAFWRYISFMLSAIPIYIGYFMIGWTPKKRGLHDYLAGTYVVYGKPGKIIKP